MSGGELALATVAAAAAVRPAVETKPLPGVKRALAHIHANPAQALGCRDIANLAGLSISQCARQFRRMTGVAPHRYLLQVRVAHVKTLLRESDRDLALIAMDAGFFDQSHMTRVFRRLTGVTPGVFREADRVT
jgi:AraC family transcriptional regulator